jgi:hypothetical protein
MPLGGRPHSVHRATELLEEIVSSPTFVEFLTAAVYPELGKSPGEDR